MGSREVNSTSRATVSHVGYTQSDYEISNGIKVREPLISQVEQLNHTALRVLSAIESINDGLFGTGEGEATDSLKKAPHSVAQWLEDTASALSSAEHQANTILDRMGKL